MVNSSHNAPMLPFVYYTLYDSFLCNNLVNGCPDLYGSNLVLKFFLNDLFAYSIAVSRSAGETTGAACGYCRIIILIRSFFSGQFKNPKNVSNMFITSR